jgi:dihydroorotate dehydrogenase electron transfer subunit
MTLGAKGRFSVRLRKRERLSPLCHLLVLERPGGFPDARPGQFVSIRVSDAAVPLLRRPYSILDLTARSLSILVKVVGRSSAMLVETKRGAQLDLIGPLGGTEFPAPGDGKAVFVAGGTGIAPLVFAARTWRREGRLADARLIYGASTKGELLRDLVEDAFDACSFSTLDGSAEFRGDVVGLCERLLGGGRIAGGTLYSCGPRGMVRSLVEGVGGGFVEHYTSLECVMACGVGACRGCTVPLRRAGESVLKAVCSDGTVFRATEVAWEEWEE